jgi:hypothetical protein
VIDETRVARSERGFVLRFYEKDAPRFYVPKRGGRAASPARRVAGVSIVAKIFLSM